MRLLSSLLLLAQAVFAQPGASLLEEGSHCVAYKVEKVTFLVSKSAVIGKNCDISAQVLPEVGGLYHIEVNIPLRSFNSGDEERDKDVQKILREDEKPELTFRSKAQSAADWQALFAKKQFAIQGELSIGLSTYPIIINAQYLDKNDNAEVDGTTKVRFADFGLTPPKVVGGIVTKAKPDLELHFHLVIHRILGADSIRLGKDKL